MAGLSPDAERAVRDEAQRVVRELVDREAREFVDEERKRARRGYNLLAGINVTVLVALIGATWAFIRTTVEDQVKTHVEASPVVIDRISRLHSDLDKAFENIGEKSAEMAHQVEELDKKTTKQVGLVEASTSNLEERIRMSQEKIGEDILRIREQRAVIDEELSKARRLLDMQRASAETQNRELEAFFQQEKTRLEGLAESAAKLAGLADPDVFTELTAWASGEGEKAVALLQKKIRLAADFERIRWRTLPIGSIVAWHETPDGVSIPTNLVGRGKPWRKCDGSLLDDSDSPFHERRLPNLNDEGRFLRGGPVSGVQQDEQVGPHRHAMNPRYLAAGRPAHYMFPNVQGQQTNSLHIVQERQTGDVVGDTEHVEETRPVNMSVVWIIRVK